MTCHISNVKNTYHLDNQECIEFGPTTPNLILQTWLSRRYGKIPDIVPQIIGYKNLKKPDIKFWVVVGSRGCRKKNPNCHTLITLLRIPYLGRIGSTKLVLPKWHKYGILNRVIRVSRYISSNKKYRCNHTIDQTCEYRLLQCKNVQKVSNWNPDFYTQLGVVNQWLI